MLVLIALMTCPQITAQDKDFITPSIVAVQQGDRSEFGCRPNSSSDVQSWMFQPVGASDGVFIYSSGVGANINKSTSFSVRKFSDGSVDLIINSTQLSDAGLYTCLIRVNVTEVGAITIIRQTAQLIVVEREPICRATSEINATESIEIECTVRYRGNWRPVMEWWENGGHEPISHVNFEKATVENVTVTSTCTLRLLANSGANYICKVYFNETIKIDHKGIPTTNNTCMWTSQLHNSSTSTSSTSPLNNSYLLVVLAIFAAASSVVLVLLMKRKRYTKDRNSVQNDEPLNRCEYFEVECSYEEVADCETPPAARKNMTSVRRNGKLRLLGDDGTEYLDMNGLKEEKESTASTEKPLHATSKYAGIDHRFKVSDLQS